jgi:hypothetical protein
MLSGFETFLSKSRKIPENRIKFYLHWVQRFLKSCKYQPDDINAKQVDKFLDSLEVDNNIADWQVRQAADAVIIYVELFLKKQLGSTDHSDSNDKTRKLSPAWGRVFEDVRDTICLRHHSMSAKTVFGRTKPAGQHVTVTTEDCRT